MTRRFHLGYVDQCCRRGRLGEQNKAASRRWIEVFKSDDAAEAEIRGPNYIAHAPASLEPKPLDPDAWTKFLAGFVNGFPDLRLTVEDAVGEGDLVARRVPSEGTHTGEFQGLPPTHRKVSFSGLESTTSSMARW